MVAKMEQYREKSSEGQKTTVAKPGPVKAMQMPENPSTLHVNMQQHNLGEVKVGDKMTVTVHGKVSAHNHDKYGHTVRLDVHKIANAEPRGGANRQE